MQSNKINIPASGAVTMPCTGTGFWFESGTSTTANQYIIVKPDTGAEFRLKPGQNCKDPKTQVSTWYIKAEDPTAVIAGNVIIGNGDFNDDNTANLVTITATAVTNAAALPVQKQALSTLTDMAPVTIGTGTAQALVSDPTQRILRIRNASTSAILYIGGADLTITNAVIALNPGDMWIEEEAAGAAWYAISDTAGTIVKIQGLKL